MPIVIRPDGTFVADTVDEAIELHRRLSLTSPWPHAHAHTHAHALAVTLQTADTVMPQPPEHQQTAPLALRAVQLGTMALALTVGMRLILAAIKAHPKGVTTSQLAREVGAPSPAAFSGTVSGLAKNFRKGGLDFDEVIERSAEGYGRDRVVTYRPTELLMRADVPVER